MAYARIVDGAVAEYPYSLRKLRADNPNTSFPQAPGAELLAGFGVFEVAPTDAPVPDEGETVEAAAPALVNGTWTQQWAVRNLTSEELQARVPQSVTMRQARLALLGAGVLSAVDAAIAAMDEPSRTAAQIAWEYSTEVQRSFGLVSQLAPALGLTDAQVDALFVAAAKL